MIDLIGTYMVSLEAGGYSPETTRERGYVLRRADADLPYGLDVAAARELEQWLARPRLDRPKWSRWTRWTYWQHLNSFYAWAVARDYLSWSPMEDLARPRLPQCEPRPASEEQLAIALGVPRPWRTAVLLAAFDGLRCAEIARLRREDVTRDWLPVLRKGGKEQLLPTHELVWEEISTLPPGPVVPRTRGGHFPAKGLSIAVSRRLTAVGLAELTLHRFRHRFATIMLLEREAGGAGANIRTVQELLGHASVASTQVYTQVTDRQRRQAMAALPGPGAAVLKLAA